MRIRIFAAALILSGIGAGCSSPQGESPRNAQAAAVPAGVGALAAPGLPGRRADGIASLPDRGQLVAFRRDVRPRRTLAYTWRPVDLSEAHALNAIGGELVVTGPDGQPIRLRYEHHVEHPDGNWTWIGRPSGDPTGEEAIITFGQKAVFGSIPHGRGPALQITTGGGRLWMMETDPRAVASLPGAHPGGTDALLPPIRARQGAAPVRQAGALKAVAAGTGAPVVDVLLGYTSGFATRLGGQSQANTRLVNLIDIANQAYANSQLPGRVRLVKTMQVNYPDTTSNESALYALTGCNGTSCTQVDPALQPLHDAREIYRADMISLVRNFNDPENGSCGIAWLLGGGQLAIQPADEYAAMSVVSDSNGVGAGSFPDNGYVCFSETLAHELGHNMGLAHDRDTSDGADNVLQAEEYGRYPYSFGYKNAANAFFTVMAYGDDGQHLYRVFSNPRTTYCGGLACGITDQADNARTLQQTMPVVADFRSGISARADFNGDRISDILWHNTASNANVIWRSASSATTQAVTATAWGFGGIGDFNSDGFADVFWRNAGTGANVIWRSANSATPQAVSALSTAWTPAAVADFDGDHAADILWRNGSSGANVIWRSANASTTLAVTTVGNTAWKVAAAGDFDGNGKADILWRNTSTGGNLLWRDADSAKAQSLSTASVQWTVAGAGDFDGDGTDDILWRNTATGANELWRGGSGSNRLPVTAVANQSWQVAGIADFNGDGQADVLWRNGSTGANQLWRSANSATTQPINAVSTSWVPHS